MKWFETLDFEENPFGLDSLRNDFEILGREEEKKEILYRLSSGSMLVIKGTKGIGKTSLLKFAIDNFRGEGRVVYVDANKVNKKLNISNMMKKRGMILLLDNVESLSKKNNERIKYYFDEDVIKSVIFTTTDYSVIDFTKPIKERIGENIIKLGNLSEDNAIKIVKDRLLGKEILNDDILKELYKISKKEKTGIKGFLRYCEKLCEFKIKQKDKEITEEDIKRIIKEEKSDKASEINESDLCFECNSRLVKINGNWRCEKCDRFCKHCGAIVEEEDIICPECLKEIKNLNENEIEEDKK